MCKTFPWSQISIIKKAKKADQNNVVVLRLPFLIFSQKESDILKKINERSLKDAKNSNLR